MKAWICFAGLFIAACSSAEMTPNTSASSSASASNGGATASTSNSSAASSVTVGAGGAAQSTGSGKGGAGGGDVSPSGEAIPSADLPGWKLIFSDDFTTDAPLGSFPGADYPTWTAYPDGWLDTSKNGTYAPEKTLSVKSGVLTIDVHTENGVHYSSAPEPMKGQGQVYGRYSVRFRATETTGDYKTAWLLWPDSNKWPDDGEIDFPEGNLDSTIGAYAHYANPAGGQDAFGNTGVTYTSWHTATTEWSAGNVTFLLDGTVIGTSTTMVPSTSMHYVLQTETKLSGGAPADASVGNLEIDWVVIWAKE